MLRLATERAAHFLLGWVGLDVGPNLGDTLGFQ